jgi:hypothetical protein
MDICFLFDLFTVKIFPTPKLHAKTKIGNQSIFDITVGYVNVDAVSTNLLNWTKGCFLAVGNILLVIIRQHINMLKNSTSQLFYASAKSNFLTICNDSQLRYRSGRYVH